MVGVPTTLTINIDLEADCIFSMFDNYESNDTPLTAMLEMWQSEDSTIWDLVAGYKLNGPTRPIPGSPKLEPMHMCRGALMCKLWPQHAYRDTGVQSTTIHLEVSRSSIMQPPRFERDTPGGSTTVLLERLKEWREVVCWCVPRIFVHKTP